MTIKTETVSSGNYFGEEEMIFEVRERLLTAKVKSSKVEVLEVSKEKFDKMLEYSDFYDCVKRGA
jgi:CRP-like cAMP-binding protein